jgi:hypothetical protein
MCANPIWPFPRRDDNQKVEDRESGTRIPFRPDDCLMIYGYGGLKRRDFNAWDSNWGQ